MQKITLTTLLTCILLNSCATHTKKGLPIVPEIKYALSGGAGHYDYAPSFIIDEY